MEVLNYGGANTVLVTEYDLENFPSLYDKCLQRNVSEGKGVFKARFHTDIQRCSLMPEILLIVKLAESSFQCELEEQKFDAFSSNQNVFSYRSRAISCTSGPFQQFIQSIEGPDTFHEDQNSCCLSILKECGVSALLKHYWQEVRKASTADASLYNEIDESAIEKMLEAGKVLKDQFQCTSSDSEHFENGHIKQRNLCVFGVPKKYNPSCPKVYGKVHSTGSHSVQYNASHKCVNSKISRGDEDETKHLQESTKQIFKNQRIINTAKQKILNKFQLSNKILNVAGIPVPKDHPLYITQKFSLSKLGTILDLYPEELEGVTSPLLYIGMVHSTTPFQEHVSALPSISFLHHGACKVWITVDPKYLGFFCKCLTTTPLLSEHTACRNVLGHRVAMLGIDYLDKNGITYSVVIQQPGEFIIVEPNVPHMIFNTGWNVAETVCFANEKWIIPGIYSRHCHCFRKNVRIDMTPFIATFSPRLLRPSLNQELYSPFPPSNGQSILLTQNKLEVLDSQSSFLKELDSESNVNDKEKFCHASKASYRSQTSGRLTLKCLLCSKSYQGGLCKLDRLLKHCMHKHQDVHDIEQQTRDNYERKWKQPKRHPCPKCGGLFAGTPDNLRKHMKRIHPDAINYVT